MQGAADPFTPIRVEYRSPWTTAAVRFLICLIIIGFFAFIAALLWWGVVVNSNPGNASLTWAGTILIGFATLPVGWFVGREYPSRLVITEDGVTLGSWIFKRHFVHDAINLVELHREVGASEKVVAIRLETRWRRYTSGPLRVSDAIEAWEAIRSLNPNALGRYFAGERDHTLILPNSPIKSDPLRLREAMLDSLRARRRRAGLTTIAFTVITIAAALALIYFRQSISSVTLGKVWALALLGPFAAIAAGLMFIAAHRRLRALLTMQREELDAKPSAWRGDIDPTDWGATG